MAQKVLIVVGPTASGKSALGVALARQFNGEVISADSRQVYKGLDIGTGKITKKEMKGVPHHLLDVANPKRPYSVAKYVQAAQKIYSSILQNTRIPIVVGGTGFYIDALVGRITVPDVAPNNALRARLAKRSASQLYAALQKLDPARAKSMSSPSEKNNKIRLMRAVEIATAIGKIPKPRTRSQYDTLWIGVKPADAELRTRINTRLRERLKSGMVAEAKRLHAAGLSYKRMRELGLEYRSLARHLQGEITQSEMETELQSDIWRYARKQIGYWKRNRDIHWYDPKSKKIPLAVKRWLAK